MALLELAKINFGLGLIGWIIVGLVAGWLAHMVMGSGGGGLVQDLIVGLLGALVGGFIIGFFVNASYGLIGSIIVAFIGALILTAIVHAISGGRSPV